MRHPRAPGAAPRGCQTREHSIAYRFGDRKFCLGFRLHYSPFKSSIHNEVLETGGVNIYSAIPRTVPILRLLSRPVRRGGTTSFRFREVLFSRHMSGPTPLRGGASYRYLVVRERVSNKIRPGFSSLI